MGCEAQSRILYLKSTSLLLALQKYATAIESFVVTASLAVRSRDDLYTATLRVGYQSSGSIHHAQPR